MQRSKRVEELNVYHKEMSDLKDLAYSKRSYRISSKGIIDGVEGKHDKKGPFD